MHFQLLDIQTFNLLRDLKANILLHSVFKFHPMKNLIAFLVTYFISINLLANNIAISNISTPSINTSAGANNVGNFRMIEFDLAWENSWRMSFGPNNWDAAWVFVKYRVNTMNGGDGLWKHATLNNIGHVAPIGSTIDVGLVNQAAAFNTLTNPGVGAFIYRNAEGYGNNNFTNVQLRWNYGANGLFDATLLDIQIFAIEMVYIPGGFNFNVGGGGGSNAFPSTSINTSNATLIGSGYPFGANNNPAFPNGYNHYYCMKYEISQQQMVDFLNTLTYIQQASRTMNVPSSAIGTAAYSNTFRNGIDVLTPGVSATSPAVYACNLNANALYGETNDGQWIACNFLNYADLAAYLDWSGLRPMTELEFEKSCRGDLPPLLGEYAWGSSYLSGYGSIFNPGTSSEWCGPLPNVATNSSVLGVVRVGSFATASSSRVNAGATYYGILEMSGNVREMAISCLTNPVFNGLNGNGMLSTNGEADVNNWPSNSTAIGIGLRGGAWNESGLTGLGVSDRFLANFPPTTRINSGGGRGVRSAP